MVLKLVSLLNMDKSTTLKILFPKRVIVEKIYTILKVREGNQTVNGINIMTFIYIYIYMGANQCLYVIIM